MPAYTSPDNIQYPVSTDQVAPLETVFANMAQSTQNAFDGFRIDWNDFEANRAIQTFRWADSTERASQAGMVAGDRGYQIDTATFYTYIGGTWVSESPTTVTITPGTNCAINASTSVKRNEITGLVVANLDISRTSGSFTTGDAIATFPSDARPAATLSTGAGFVNATPVFASLSSAGVVNIYFTGTTTNQFRGTFIFYV
jgi:hypothetical protein